MSMMLCFALFFVSVFMIMSQSGHFFMVLLSFEVVTLSLFFMLVSCVFTLGSMSSTFVCLMFLVFSVCEASLGLGLLVSSMRGQGFDFIKASLSLKF